MGRYTKEQMRVYMANRRRDRRNELLRLGGGECVDCAAVEDLEFDHVDRTKKRFVLSGKNLDRKWSDLLEELQKCEVVCHPCHLVRTRRQWDTNELVAAHKGVVAPYVHGTARRYFELSCRCPDCKYSGRLYRRKKTSYQDVNTFVEGVIQ